VTKIVDFIMEIMSRTDFLTQFFEKCNARALYLRCLKSYQDA